MKQTWCFPTQRDSDPSTYDIHRQTTPSSSQTDYIPCLQPAIRHDQLVCSRCRRCDCDFLLGRQPWVDCLELADIRHDCRKLPCAIKLLTLTRVQYVTDYGRLPAGIWDFSFLSNRAFILTSRSGNGSIEIYSFENGPEEPTPDHVASLHLPPLQPNTELALFSTHTGPFTTVPANPEYRKGPMGEDKPFTSSPQSRIHAMCVQYHLGGVGNMERRARFFLFVKNEYLMSFVDKHKQERRKRAERLDDPLELDADEIALPKLCAAKMLWDSWGYDNSRFMAYGMQFRWLRFVLFRALMHCEVNTCAGMSTDRKSFAPHTVSTSHLNGCAYWRSWISTSTSGGCLKNFLWGAQSSRFTLNLAWCPSRRYSWKMW